MKEIEKKKGGSHRKVGHHSIQRGATRDLFNPLPRPDHGEDCSRTNMLELQDEHVGWVNAVADNSAAPHEEFQPIGKLADNVVNLAEERRKQHTLLTANQRNRFNE